MRTAKSRPSGQFRIIAGDWRGRRFAFPAIDGLRPSTERVRETLFNWLAPRIRGARCLDLFAGSGALGLEALSRGAAYCDFVDRESAAIRAIRDHLAIVGAESRAGVFTLDALKWTSDKPYDIVFLDPPFGAALVSPALYQLRKAKLLAEGSRLYLEQSRNQDVVEPGEHFDLLREKTAGEVRYQLFAYQDP